MFKYKNSKLRIIDLFSVDVSRMVKKAKKGGDPNNIPLHKPENDDHYYKSHLNDYVSEVNKYESSSFMMGGYRDETNAVKSIDIHTLENSYSSPFNDTQSLDLEKSYAAIFDNPTFESHRAISNFGISNGGGSSNEFKVFKDLLNIIIKSSWDDFKSKKKGGDSRNYIQNNDDLRNDITNLGITPYEYPKPYAKIY